MGTARVRAVVAEEKRDLETAALFVLGIELRLRRETARMGALSGMQGAVRIEAAFDAEPAGDLDFDIGRLRRCAERYEWRCWRRRARNRKPSPATTLRSIPQRRIIRPGRPPPGRGEGRVRGR